MRAKQSYMGAHMASDDSFVIFAELLLDSCNCGVTNGGDRVATLRFLRDLVGVGHVRACLLGEQLL